MSHLTLMTLVNISKLYLLYFHKFKKYTKGAIKKVSDNFSYSSDTNDKWFTNDEIKKIILNAKKNHERNS